MINLEDYVQVILDNKQLLYIQKLLMKVKKEKHYNKRKLYLDIVDTEKI